MFYPEYEKKNEKQNYYSNLRLVISGSIFEFYEFSDPIMYGSRLRRKNKNNDENISVDSANTMSEEEKMLSSARRAKRNISRLIRSNAFEWFDNEEKPYMPIILTLTFAEEIRDVKEANNLFTNFI